MYFFNLQYNPNTLLFNLFINTLDIKPFLTIVSQSGIMEHYFIIIICLLYSGLCITTLLTHQYDLDLDWQKSFLICYLLVMFLTVLTSVTFLKILFLFIF